MKYTNEPCSSIYESIKDRIPVTLNAIKNIKQRKRYLKYTDCVEFELSDILIRCLDFIALRGKGVYVDEYMAKYLHDFLKRKPPFPEVAYELCKFAVSTDESIGLSERIGGIISLVTSYCKQNNIDIDFFVEQKMRYNKLRPFKHRNKKY